MAMMTYSAAEVLKISVDIEKNGEHFYREAARTSRSLPAADLFRELAGQEVQHQAVFKEMLKSAPKASGEAYPGELDLYLKALADAVIFKQKEGAERIAAQTLTDRAALEIGQQAEKDSILFYDEVVKFVLEKDKALVEKVIEEEKKHLVKLTETLAQLG